MRTEIAFTQGAQNRVGDRVRQGIRIRMSFTTALRLNAYTAKDQGPPFDEAMRVVTDADAKHIRQWLVVSGQCVKLHKQLTTDN